MVKTLVLYGSARKKGATKELLDLFLESLGGKAGTKEIVDCYRRDIKPCIDCRHCWKKRECSIKDGMRDIYDKIDEARNIIIASPIYFNNLPGKLKIVIDRLQMYWAGETRGDNPEGLIKRGAGLLTAGAPHYNNQFTGAKSVIGAVLRSLGAKNLGIITFPHTDEADVLSDADTLRAVKELAALF